MELTIVITKTFAKVDVSRNEVTLTIIELCTKDWYSLHSFDAQDNILSASREAFT